MLINKATISALFVNIKTSFQKAFNDTKVQWEKIAMRIPSTGAQNDYAWLSRFPKMRRWVGEKHIKNLMANRYVIANADFEATIEVKRNDIKDDNLGMVGIQAKSAGKSAREWPDDLVFEAVNKGTTELCFDGQYFFDTDHPVGDSTVSNKLSNALVISTLAGAMASYGAAATLMKTYKDEEGQPLGVKPNILLVPPALGDSARVLMTAERLEDGKPNPYRGQCEVVEDARISSATAWYLLDMSHPVKPFIFQERETPNFVEQTTMESDDVFSRGVFKFGVEARGEAGYGFWQMCVQGNQ